MKNLIALSDFFCCSLDYLTGRSDDPKADFYYKIAKEKFLANPSTTKDILWLHKNDEFTHQDRNNYDVPYNHFALPACLRCLEALRDEHPNVTDHQKKLLKQLKIKKD